MVAAIVINPGFAPLGANSLIGPSSCTLIALGAKYAPFVVNYSQYWRLVSAVALPAGLFSLVINLILQFILVFPLEQAFGVR